jgi:hypothetical protein
VNFVFAAIILLFFSPSPELASFKLFFVSLLYIYMCVCVCVVRREISFCTRTCTHAQMVDRRAGREAMHQTLYIYIYKHTHTHTSAETFNRARHTHTHTYNHGIELPVTVAAREEKTDGSLSF